MLLEIDDHKTVQDLQEKFSECFPFLKIEFYDEGHKWHQGSDPAHKLNPKTPIAQIRMHHTHGILEIRSTFKTGRVEQDFKNQFGLHVQVFRCQKGAWIQSTGTDELTLQAQMDLARATLPKTLQTSFIDADDEEGY
jgi:hypothetical protein